MNTNGNGTDPKDQQHGHTDDRRYGESHLQRMTRLGAGPHIERLPPASLDPDVFDAPGYESDDLVVAAKAALKRGKEAAANAREMASAQLQNAMLTEPARHRSAKIGVHRITKPAIERFQGVIERFHAKLKALDDTLTGPKLSTQMVDVLQLHQCQAALMGMPGDRRRAIILAALKADTPSVVETAVLRAPAFLTGISDVEQADYRLTWQRKRVPDQLAQATMYRQVQEHLERGGNLLLSWSLSLYNEQLISAAEVHEKRATEALTAGTSS